MNQTGMFKTCFKCGRLLPATSFYRHRAMADGRLNKCKDCTRADVHRNYIDKLEYYAGYEKKRARAEHRKRRAYFYTKSRRKNNPEKANAWACVGRALRDGMLTKLPCEVCGEQNVEAHHDDYSKPLDVRWLCRKHHLELHGKKAYIFDSEAA